MADGPRSYTRGAAKRARGRLIMPIHRPLNAYPRVAAERPKGPGTRVRESRLCGKADGATSRLVRSGSGIRLPIVSFPRFSRHRSSLPKPFESRGRTQSENCDARLSATRLPACTIERSYGRSNVVRSCGRSCTNSDLDTAGSFDSRSEDGDGVTFRSNFRPRGPINANGTSLS